MKQTPASYEGPTTKTKAINMDLVNSVDAKRVADMTFGLLNYLQNRKDFRNTASQVIAIAAMFKLVADVFGVPQQVLAAVASNVVSDSEGHYIPEFRAVAMYLENEVKG